MSALHTNIRELIVDWSLIEQKCTDMSIQAFVDMLSNNPSETFYAFALCTDSGGMTITANANSLEKLELLVEHEERSRETDAYFMWTPAEWYYEAIRPELFKEICLELRMADKGDDFTKFKQNLVAAMIRSMRSISIALESKHQKERVFFVSASDDDDASDIENKSAIEINNPKVASEFIMRYE